MKWKKIPKDIRKWMQDLDNFPMIIHDTDKRQYYAINAPYELQNVLLFSLLAMREKYKYAKIEQI